MVISFGGKLPFDTFYQENFSHVVHYLTQKMENREDAEDLAQDVFTYCYNNYDKYDPSKASLTTWLYLVVNSRYKNYLRDRRPTEDIDDFRDVIPDDAESSESALMLQELRDQLADVLAALPERSRKLVVLRFFGNLSWKEIADKLDMTESNARVSMTRILKTMQKEMKGRHFDFSF